MRRVTVAMAAMMGCCVAPATAGDDRFSLYVLAPVSAGQTLKEAERALGAPLLAKPGDEKRACHLRTSRAHPGVGYVIDRGVLARTDTRDRRWATVRGLRVGDTEAQARQMYGKRLVIGAHPYFERGHRLAVYSADRKFALVMESDDSGRIVTLRGGQVPAVEALEGCS